MRSRKPPVASNMLEEKAVLKQTNHVVIRRRTQDREAVQEGRTSCHVPLYLNSGRQRLSHRAIHRLSLMCAAHWPITRAYALPLVEKLLLHPAKMYTRRRLASYTHCSSLLFKPLVASYQLTNRTFASFPFPPFLCLPRRPL